QCRITAMTTRASSPRLENRRHMHRPSETLMNSAWRTHKMTFSSTVTHASNSTPGVSYEVRRIGFGKRTEIDFATLSLRQRLRELEAEYPPMSEREKPLAEQVEIARRKSLAVPPEEFEAVLQNEVMPLAQELAAAIPPEV